MTWDAGPCLPGPESVEPATDEKLRALLARLDNLTPRRPGSTRGYPDLTVLTGTPDELAFRRQHRARRT